MCIRDRTWLDRENVLAVCKIAEYENERSGQSDRRIRQRGEPHQHDTDDEEGRQPIDRIVTSEPGPLGRTSGSTGAFTHGRHLAIAPSAECLPRSR